MQKAKDLMTKKVIHVKKDTPILDAVEFLVKRNITGIPVVEEDMSLIGILSEKDVLRLFSEDDDSENLTVNEFMTQPAVFFDENESIDDICECLLQNYFRRVPVTSNGKLVGILSRRDIIKIILNQKTQNNEPVNNLA
ncbi:MAG: CBS domain-containing protein [Planctomycetota bacterium]|jgi:CBS domain-containing protein